MTKDPGRDWLHIGLDTWALGTEAWTVVTLRSMVLALGGSGAWQEAQRMVTEKAAANWSFGAALASGRMGMDPETVMRGTLRHYGKRVRANRRRLSR